MFIKHFGVIYAHHFMFIVLFFTHKVAAASESYLILARWRLFLVYLKFKRKMS